MKRVKETCKRINLDQKAKEQGYEQRQTHRDKRNHFLPNIFDKLLVSPTLATSAKSKTLGCIASRSSLKL